MPIQHASDNVLKRMGRKTDKQSFDIVAKLRKEIGHCIKNNFIVGFPGETQPTMKRLWNLLMKLSSTDLSIHLFKGRDTPAATMPDQIDQDIMDTWRRAYGSATEISIDKSALMVERLLMLWLKVILQRTILMSDVRKDAPNVDGMVF
ncbi:MAG: hypothetical protein ACLS9K_04765 [Lachnospira eligens]